MNNSKKYETAPYQFIDLNKSLLPSDQPENTYDVYAKKLNHGYIEVAFKAITELFTRGVNENFKTIHGKPVFPGSSIRGPIRVIAEQMGYAEMVDVEKEEAFFFRGFDTGNPYRNKMKPNKIKGGWLTYKNGEYKLYKSKQFIKLDRESEYPIKRDVLFFRLEDQKKEYNNGETVSFKEFYVFLKDRKIQYHSKNFCISIDEDKQNRVMKGILMKSGPIDTKVKEAIIGEKSDHCIIGGKVLEDILRRIESDKNRLCQFSRTQIKNNPIPCFYIGDNKKPVVAIGFNYFFRYPYDKKVGDGIKVKETKSLDFASTIFGNESPDQNSKVFFEDFYLEKGENTKPKPEQFPHILASPKASYYPYYLKQNGKDNPKTWDDEVEIAGYKNYYHRTEQDIWIKKEFKIGDEFGSRDSNFSKHLRDFKQHKYIHFITKFSIRYNDNFTEMDSLIKKNELQYKSRKREEWGGYTYYLQLETEAHYDFFKKYSGIKYTLFYVDPPISVLKGGKEFKNFQYLTEKDQKNKETLDSKPIRVLPRGSEFKGRIRFENLSDAELGLLLLSLDLPEGHAHKIGMGKPLGLGSARFTIKLKIIDRKARYTSVFNNESWNKGFVDTNNDTLETSEQTINKFKNAFISYFEEKMPEEKIHEEKWADRQRIKDLYFLLKTEGTNTPSWTNNTRYLEMDGRKGNEFKKKCLLVPLNHAAVKASNAKLKIIKPKPIQVQVVRKKRDPTTVPIYDFDTLKIEDSLTGILIAEKRVHIKFKQGAQTVQLVVPKGEPMLNFSNGDVVDVLLYQINKKANKISQVKLKK